MEVLPWQYLRGKYRRRERTNAVLPFGSWRFPALSPVRNAVSSVCRTERAKPAESITDVRFSDPYIHNAHKGGGIPAFLFTADRKGGVSE